MKKILSIIALSLSLLSSCGVINKSRLSQKSVTETQTNIDSTFDEISVTETNGDSLIIIPEQYIIGGFDYSDLIDTAKENLIETNFGTIKAGLKNGKIEIKTTLKKQTIKPTFRQSNITHKKSAVSSNQLAVSKAIIKQNDVKKDFRLSNLTWSLFAISLIALIFIFIYYKFFKN